MKSAASSASPGTLIDRLGSLQRLCVCVACGDDPDVRDAMKQALSRGVSMGRIAGELNVHRESVKRCLEKNHRD